MFSFPWIWLAITAFKSEALVYIYPPKILFSPTFSNFIRLFSEYNLLHYLRNSLIISFGSTLLTIMIASTGAYSMARFSLGGKHLLLCMLIVRMMPPIVVIIPYYYIMMRLGLLGTYPAIILSHMIYSLTVAILLLRVSFSETPQTLEECALTDGCSSLSAFFRITLPLTAPAIIAVTILTFIASWNEFLFVMILGSSSPVNSTETLPVLLAKVGMENWSTMAALAVTCVIPVLALAYLLQTYVSRIRLGYIS